MRSLCHTHHLCSCMAGPHPPHTCILLFMHITCPFLALWVSKPSAKPGVQEQSIVMHPLSILNIITTHHTMHIVSFLFLTLTIIIQHWCTCYSDCKHTYSYLWLSFLSVYLVVYVGTITTYMYSCVYCVSYMWGMHTSSSFSVSGTTIHQSKEQEHLEMLWRWTRPSHHSSEFPFLFY